MKDVYNLANKTFKTDNKQQYFDIFLIKKKKISKIHRFTHCRGFVYDQLQWQNGFYKGLRNRYFYLHFNGRASVYKKTPMLSLKTVDIMTQVIQMMGCYELPEVYQGKDNKLLVKLDINILKNLYAFSIVLAAVKYTNSLAKKDVTTFDALLRDSKMYNYTNTILFLTCWNVIFPKKFGWQTVYGGSKGLHGQGFGELITAKTVWAELNDAAWSLLEKKGKRPKGQHTEVSMGSL